MVTVFADKFFNETTSYGAAGIFRPTLELMPGVSLETARLVIIIITSITVSDANTNNKNIQGLNYFHLFLCQHFIVQVV